MSNSHRHWMHEQQLKHRDLAHRMNDRGTPLEYIADYIDVDPNSIRRWLLMPRPVPMPRLDSDDSWMPEGLCNTVDPELWFPDRGNGTSLKAKAICRECPVVERCLMWALAHNEPYGIWGGEDADTRHKMRKNAMDREREARKREEAA